MKCLSENGGEYGSDGVCEVCEVGCLVVGGLGLGEGVLVVWCLGDGVWVLGEVG